MQEGEEGKEEELRLDRGRVCQDEQTLESSNPLTVAWRRVVETTCIVPNTLDQAAHGKRVGMRNGRGTFPDQNGGHKRNV